MDISLSNPSKISQELDNLLFRLKSNDMTLEHIAEFHAEFEKIHPFGDGNGRIGRLIMAFQCIQNDMIPPLIESRYRTEYLDNLYKAQISNNFTQLSKFLEFCQNSSLALIEKFESNIDDDTPAPISKSRNRLK